MKKGISLVCLLFVLLTLTNCKKEESILKVFVRSASNQLINGAKVIVIGDQQSTPPTGAFVDTVFTNSSGFTTINWMTILLRTKTIQQVTLISLLNITRKLVLDIQDVEYTQPQLKLFI